jgi:hypothetical protein
MKCKPVHVKWVHCHHCMARPRVDDRGDGLQICSVAANILNKQSRTADSGWYSSLVAGRGTKNPTVKKTQGLLRNTTHSLGPGGLVGPVKSCLECGDEPFGSCDTELVSQSVSQSVI